MTSPTELSYSESDVHLSTVAATAATDTSSYPELAWHILALLFSLGRPARPSELASRCTFFNMTPNFVEFLCSLPNSPVELNCSCFVTFSSVGYVAIANLAKNSDMLENLDFVPRFLGELGLRRQMSDGRQALRTYFRKRMRMDLDGKCLPVERRRGNLNKVDAQHDYTTAMEFTRGTDTCSGKAYFSDSNMCNPIAAQPYKPPLISFNECEPDRGVLGTNSSLSYGNAMFISDAGSDQPSIAIERTIVTRTGSSSIFCAESGRYQLNCPNDNLYALALESQQKITEAIPVEKVTNLANLQRPVASMTTELKGDDHGTMMEVMEISKKALENPPQSSCCAEGPTENPMHDTTAKEVPHACTSLDNVAIEQRKMVTSGDKCRTPLSSQETLTNPVIPSRPKQQAKTFPKPKHDQMDAKSERLKLIAKTLDYGNDTHSLEKQQQLKKYRKSIPLNQSSQRNTDQNKMSQPKMEGNKNLEQSSLTLPPNKLEKKVLPDFESFVAEEQEGSGGYGTVYRARRKTDGSAFAIKCPHVNANKNHVRNELKMLERFGGKNFIIKYEGSFKEGDSDCLVLEHVEHDRPEVLKREINVSELQWYGYCMFRALASLHKQGIIHRDVKPGNFLFNRKACKGFLIDFNLALDLHQKQGRSEKKRMSKDISLSLNKSLPPTKSRKPQTSKSTHFEHQEQGKVPKFALQPKKSKNDSEHPKLNNKGGNWSMIKSQGADGSGITSAKDTSTMTLSGEKRKEPLPSHGRKELLSLLQEALQGVNQKEVNGPVSKRKRVEAPVQQVVDRKITYQTPMPLHSAGIAAGGAGLLENKGSGKHNREGPCVGTKGFRAPEVLFRSLYQSPKVDIWSAGVTLLYLITGRSPFTGEPDQNVKEIAKLRGSEDLWEVAKLHGHEYLFPQELHDVKSLASVKLRDWCKVHTRKPDFLNVIPKSLLDLVDKCLTVNPRLRISAEDALKHDFFAPCHEALRKHRLHRQGVNLDFDSNPLSQVESQV